MSGGYETVIGVEVHVQLRTVTKMFCGCRATYGQAPNTQVCPVCLGLPGALPVANRRATELAVRAALLLGCEVRESSEFVRKNYFYPDLPKGYQITQFESPLAEAGKLWLRSEEGERSVRIRRLHLEEDAGKSLHDRFPGSTAVDLNRAGVPLIEIVTEPDLRSPAEARAYLVRLKQLLEHFARVSDCNMEEGSLRVDANLSVRPAGHPELGTKTEVKNLNSFANVERALAHEAERQARVLEAGGEVAQETRLFDPASGETHPMRGKEGSTDYRYFPEPDLPLLVLEAQDLARLRRECPETPHELEGRLMEAYDLSEYDAALLAATPERASYFEEAVSGEAGDFAKQAANFIMGELAAEANRRSDGAAEAELLPAATLARVVRLRLEGTLSSSTASRTLELLLGEDSGRSADEVVEAHGLAQVRDTDRLEGWVAEALAAHPEEARRLAGGEEKLVGFFMGEVMRAARGKADPAKARELLMERAGDPAPG